MKAKKIGLIALSAIMVSAGIAGLAACGDSEEVSDQIVNGGFEQNTDESTWLGWTREGNAFSARSVVDNSKYTENGSEKTAVVDMEGEKFFFGIGGGNSSRNTGTLTSNTFKLSGTGKIAFKMGAAKNGEKVYVEFYEKGGKTVLAKVTNEDFNDPYITNHMIRKIVDLSAHVGKDIYIKITDDDNGKDYGYVNLDDFVMCATEEDVTKYEQERAAQLKKYGEPSFTETPTNTTIDNGGFETGDLTNWKILEGKAFLPANVVPATQRYWGDRSVYAYGDYYIDGSNNGQTEEAATGAIRSQKFTLAGDGYITFMMGSGKSNCYVAICDGETDDELIKVENDYFNDPYLPLTLLRRYVDASEYIGKVLYIKVVDNSVSGGFNFITVDDFRVSLTAEEVSALQVEQYKAIATETYTGAAYNDLASLKDYYDNYEYLFPLEVPVFTKYAPNVVRAVSADPVDLTSLIAGVSAKFGDDAVSDIKISKVVCGEKEYLKDFAAFDISEEGIFTITYTATSNDMRSNATLQLVVLKSSDESTIENGGFETGDLTGWTVVSGDIDLSAGTSSADHNDWVEHLPYNKTGNYFCANAGLGEHAKWELASSVFTLAGNGYISYKMASNNAILKVYKADGTMIYSYACHTFADKSFPHVEDGGNWCTLRTHYADLSDFIGEKLIITIGNTGAGGAWEFGYFDDIVTYYAEDVDMTGRQDDVLLTCTNDGKSHAEGETVKMDWIYAENESDRITFVNPVKDTVKAAAESFDVTGLLNGVSAVCGSEQTVVTDITITKVVCEENEITSEFNSLELTEGKIYQVFYKAVYGKKTAETSFLLYVHSNVNQVANGGFETGNLAGWTVLTDGWGKTDGIYDGVISAQSYWGEALPYNQSGEYHLDGWNTGIAEGDTWAIRSSEFTLGGSGWISVKMGGHAAVVKVYKADGTQIGTYAQSRFNDDHFPYVGQGGSWADMANYAIDLSAYIGEELYVELCDVAVDGWAFAFFDDVITYYENAPEWSNLSDTVTDGHKGDETAKEVQIPWVLAENGYEA